MRSAVTFPLPPRLLGIAGVQLLDLEVVEVAELGQRMRRVRLASPVLTEFAYQPGQDIMLVLGGTEDRPLSRRYSIRSIEAHVLELNIVAHGVHGPGAMWAASAQPGDRVAGVGPRGKISVDPDADWHIFVGDESAAPASLNMLEALAASVPGTAYLEVASSADELASQATGVHSVTWLHRGDTPETASTRLLDIVQSATLPAGRGHLYAFGEVQMVAALKTAALARGLSGDQISAKAYWGRSKPNADRGEPD